MIKKALKALFQVYFLVAFLLPFFGLIAFDNTDFGHWFRFSVVRKVEFLTRNLLDLNPKLDPRIKLYVYDDRTFANLSKSQQGGDLYLNQWYTVLQSLDKYSPKAIIIDKYFGDFIFQEEPQVNKKSVKRFQEVSRLRNEKAKQFVNNMSRLKSKIIIGSFFGENKSELFKQAKNKPSFFNIKEFLSEEKHQFKEGKAPPGVEIINSFVYSAHESIEQVFKHVGHFEFDGRGLVAPFFVIKSGLAVPYISLLAADDLEVSKEGVLLDKRKIPLTKEGRIQVNLSTNEEYYKHTWSMYPLIMRALFNKPHKGIDKDSIVILLPAMFTGKTDFVDTPQGIMPGGFIITAIVNSILSNNWLQEVQGGYFFLMLYCFLGALMGRKMPNSWFWLSLSGIVFAIFCIGVYFFAFKGYIVPWSLPALGFAFSSSFSNFRKNLEISAYNRKIETSLEGFLSEEQIEDVKNAGDFFDLQPCHREVSILFLDVVGFSLVAEVKSAEDTFELLKPVLSQISETVHKYGGIVDNVLGDGLLCFFGYNYTGRQTMEDHAYTALSCALEIQRNNINWIEKQVAKEQAIFPLRIGINTAFVQIGDLGTTKSFRPTIIGDGVNFAARLESACEEFKILMSPSTLDRIGNRKDELEAKIADRYISIKHHEELFEAYDVNPFVKDQEGLLRAKLHYELQKEQMATVIKTDKNRHVETRSHSRPKKLIKK